MKIEIEATSPTELRATFPTFTPPIKIEVDAEVIGDVLVYQSPTSLYWIAKNQVTGYVTNNAEKHLAIADAAQKTIQN